MEDTAQPEKKTVAEWEKLKGFMLYDDSTLDQLMTEEEFNSIPISDKHGVRHEDRIKFLTDNGYEVTRANMVNPELSVRA